MKHTNHIRKETLSLLRNPKKHDQGNIFAFKLENSKQNFNQKFFDNIICNRL